MSVHQAVHDVGIINIVQLEDAGVLVAGTQLNVGHLLLSLRLVAGLLVVQSDQSEVLLVLLHLLLYLGLQLGNVSFVSLLGGRVRNLLDEF